MSVFSVKFLGLCPPGKRSPDQKAVFLIGSQLGQGAEGFNSNPLSTIFTLIWELANQLGNSSVIEHVTDTE